MAGVVVAGGVSGHELAETGDCGDGTAANGGSDFDARPPRSFDCAFALGAVVSLVVCGGAVLSGLLAGPAPVASMPVHCDADLPTLQAGQSLRVLVWNLQFAGTTKHQFFYDDGEAVHVPPGDVTWALDEIAKVIAEVDPDIMLLQEIDRGSDRTGRCRSTCGGMHRLCTAAGPGTKMAYMEGRWPAAGVCLATSPNRKGT